MEDLLVVERFNIGGRDIELHGYGDKPISLSYEQEDSMALGIHTRSIDKYICYWELRDVTNSWCSVLLRTKEKPTKEAIEIAVASRGNDYTTPIIAGLILVSIILWFLH